MFQEPSFKLIVSDGIVIGAEALDLEGAKKLIAWHDILQERLTIAEFVKRVKTLRTLQTGIKIGEE